MDNIVILLGSNLGVRKALMHQAKQMLEAQLGKCIRQSSIYESRAWGFQSENNFLNQVICFKKNIKAEDLLIIAQQIEKDLGRNRKSKTYESRTMDVDILFYGENKIEKDDLQIPHPKLHLRKFTLMPLAEIMPDFVHPELKKTIHQLLNSCNDTNGVIKLEN